MAIETPVRPDVVPPRSTDPTKKRAKRFGAITGALFGFFALGIAFAYFLSDLPVPGNEARGGTLNVVARDLPLQAHNLFPTNASDGGTSAEEQQFFIDNTNPAAVSYSMAAECTNCPDEGTFEDEQWGNLYISIKDSAGKTLYSGRLADMHDGYAASPLSNPLSPAAGGPVALGKIASGESSDYVARVWLKESGEPQEQNVLNTWTFIITGKSESE